MLTHSPDPPTQPAANADKTLTGIVHAPVRHFPTYGLLTLQLPAMQMADLTAGRYFLVRCGAQSEFERLHQWHFYTRQSLFVAGIQTLIAPPADHADSAPTELWALHLPFDQGKGEMTNPVFQWLQNLKPGAALNLIGPLGQGFVLHPNSRRLLLVANAWHIPTLFTLIEPMLDLGGHVTLLVDASPPPHVPINSANTVDTADIVTALIPQLPIAVEAHVLVNPAEFEQ
ncbi:MAG: hypothetical protein KDE54_23490, partial [Caldilineaceae bacterium]|nr:hypothetical protein [Caldilineaceae bacterium]